MCRILVLAFWIFLLWFSSVYGFLPALGLFGILFAGLLIGALAVKES